MSSLEKLAKVIEQLKLAETSNDNSTKKRELKVLIQTLVDLNCSSQLQTHKEFPTYIGPSIDVLMKHYDSKGSDIRLASDEGLCRIIKALIPCHSNRVLVELCRQIKKNDSPRVLKLAMIRFADLCHFARPQKQRAYLANLLNAISNIAACKEETLHESLAHFIQKVFSAMGIFAFENESKSLLKVFLHNLNSESATIRRSAAISITAIISTNRKSEVLLSLVAEYLIDQIMLNEEKTHEIPVIIGTLITLKMIVPLYSALITTSSKGSQQTVTSTSQLSTSSMERIIQMFELSIHYSTHPSDHNVSNAALELLLQLLKLRHVIILAIPALKSASETSCARISSSNRLLKPNSQWNISPIPFAEESNLVEQEVGLKTLVETFEGSIATDADTNVGETPLYLGVSFAENESAHCSSVEEVQDSVSINDINELERSTCLIEPEEPESTLSQTQDKITDYGTLYFTRDCSPIIFAAQHLAYNFLLTTRKGELKSDRIVRVSTKCLALNCLTLLGAIEPDVWNTLLIEAPNNEDSIVVTDVLQYRTHDDPQIRGQIGLLSCGILQSTVGGVELLRTDMPTLLQIVEETLKDRETAACRLALQGLQFLFPVALESPVCSTFASLLLALFDLCGNSYWLAKVDLIEVFSLLPWSTLKYIFAATAGFNAETFKKRFIKNVLLRLIGDEDHRVRNAVADCIPILIRSWSTEDDNPVFARLEWVQKNPSIHVRTSVAGIPVTISSLAEAYKDSECNFSYMSSLRFFVKLLFKEMAMSRSKFSKIGSIQALATLSSVHRPVEYLESYGCELSGSCDLLSAAVVLMISSPMMLDLGTHQALLILAGQLYAGCVKANFNQRDENVTKDELFLSSSLNATASDMLCHICRILNCFCCIMEDINPLSQAPKPPLVALPSASALSPIRRMSKSTDPSVGGTEKDEKTEKEDLGRKWSKPSQLLNQQNLGHFASYPLYIKLYDLLKATYSTCKLTFDVVTSDRLSNFIKSVLDVLGIILEVATFQDVGRYCDELLSYLRWIITFEPIACLYSVQQLLKSLFGSNLASILQEQRNRNKGSDLSSSSLEDRRNTNLHHAFGLGSHDLLTFGSLRKTSTSSRTHENACHVVKFRTTVGKMSVEKTALSAHIRLFEPMVIKALKLYTITSSTAVQKQVLDLLCELIHLRVNYRMLDADQVFLNYVIQQFEFLEEGFIPDVEILLPSMFRFLALLSYDQYHSKTIISVPRIMQLSGGLMAAGKETQRYVLPTLEPMVEDLFLSRERKDDNSRELETQKEVLINILLRLIHYHQVFPLLSVILAQVHAENVVKWRLLSKQICDILIPQLYNHALDLDSIDALVTLQRLFFHLDSPVVHESLLGLLQVFASSPLDDIGENAKYHRVLASRLTVLEIFAALFDEAFLLDCLNEFNLTYLVDRRSDPLNVTPTENYSAERILSSLMVSTLKFAIIYSKLKLDRNRISPSFISWEIDSSFNARLLLQLTRLFQHIKQSGRFPVLKIAVFDELSREEKNSSILRICSNLIPSNPVVFVRLCNLLPKEATAVILNKNLFQGFKGSIAKHGSIIAVCEELTSEELDSNLLAIFADEILHLSEEPSVKKLYCKIFRDSALTNKFLDLILQYPLERRIKNMYYLLTALESINEKVGAEIIVLFSMKLTKLDSHVIHNKFKKIIKSYSENDGSSQLLNSCKSHVESAPIFRYYTDLFSNISERAPDPDNFPRINKNFVLNFAAKRRQKQFDWEKICYLLDRSDFDALIRLEYHLKDILLSSCKLNVDLFRNTLASFFQRLKKENSTYPISQSALVVVQLLDTLSPPEMKSIFAPTEIIELSRLPLMFLASMSGIENSIVLMYSSSNIISRFENAIASEWSKKENLPLLLHSIKAVETFIVCFSNGKILNCTEFLHFSVSELDENLMKCARSLGNMVAFLEREDSAFCEPLQKYIRTVLGAFCQVPLFYSYICIPPAVWARNWTPQYKLDMENLTMDLPIVPSAYLHDEIIFEQFLFRIDLIGWINRQKFEEVWMTLLGIINLQNEEDCRPEEQASIVLATCKAVLTITKIIQKNLSLLSSTIKIENNSKRIMNFTQSERGKKLSGLLKFLPVDKSNPKSNYLSHESCNRVIFNIIEKNLSMGSPSKKSATPENMTHVDVHSCVYFLKDLYSQWLQSPDTPCALVTEVLRSLYEISNFFTDISSFEWMFDCATNILKFVQQDDPQSLESALTKCIFKSASFIALNADSWELVRKHCENSLNSQYIMTRTSTLGSLLYLLQRLVANADQARAASLANLVMDYASKYLGTEKPGPEWHQSWLWTLAFYLAEHFPDMPFRNYLVIDFVVQCALNGILENNFQSISLHQQILQGIERLCMLGAISLNKRKLIKMEVVNLVRNFDRESILLYALRTLLALVYTDFTSQLYKPGVDPESMLVAMEWVESLFYRMRHGTDHDASIIGRIMPSITSDMFSPADVLNRVLSEFISARPAVACSLTPTIFEVFATARKHDQQSLVFEWILFSLANFTKAAPRTEAVAAWNILCFFTAASENPWLHAVFPSVSRPMDPTNASEIQIFVAAALDFRSQLGANHQSTLMSTFDSAKHRSPFFAGVVTALPKLKI